MTAAILAFPYEQKLKNIAFACVFFGAGSFGMIAKVSTNQRELIFIAYFTSPYVALFTSSPKGGGPSSISEASVRRCPEKSRLFSALFRVTSACAV
jgi:hypothetical protein